MDEYHAHPGLDSDATDPIDRGRREALAKAGKFAGFTAPVVLTLLTTNAATAWAGSSPVGARPRFPVRGGRHRKNVLARLLRASFGRA